MNGFFQLWVQASIDGGNTITMFQSGPERYWKGKRVVSCTTGYPLLVIGGMVQGKNLYESINDLVI